MKEYHTKVEIIAPKERVWKTLIDFERYIDWNPLVSHITGKISEGETIKTTIVPLENTFAATLLSFKENKEIVWKGKQVASFLLAGEHYYRLKEQNENLTILEHGEYFTGVLSVFISKNLIQKMERAFVAHNLALKERIENEK
ncbi:MAG: SRPBCC domain-containing protein [Phaeodactylibacter sp.]|uniref:SRPBCC domain-containing protein n=1 Tax=Phaeodactylibacter sp. TaxID=1940289 RepID=UPI0032EF2D07